MGAPMFCPQRAQYRLTSGASLA
uniref:Uncharacterized protein n=1 Tax=Anguilla anguilla TaxID=7936 RepID=A0A0E9RTF6_ANGAN